MFPQWAEMPAYGLGSCAVYYSEGLSGLFDFATSCCICVKPISALGIMTLFSFPLPWAIDQGPRLECRGFLFGFFLVSFGVFWCVVSNTRPLSRADFHGRKGTIVNGSREKRGKSRKSRKSRKKRRKTWEAVGPRKNVPGQRKETV